MSARKVAGIAMAIACGACSDATKSAPLAIPSFLVVGDSGGFSEIYRVQDTVVTRLTSAGDNIDPKSAASRIVFTSNRDGNAEVYIADTSAITSRRVTSSGAQDDHPALDPSGTTIVFVSNRGGAPRLYTVPAPALDATAFDAPVALETGSATSTPEGAPAWSPDATAIAFSSTRTGSSQIFTVPAAGGDAVQLTTEAAGAFNPAWSANGATIYFTSATGALHLRKVQLSNGSVTDFASDSLDLDAATCDATLCLAAENPSGGAGSILAFPVKGGRAQSVLARTRHEREAEILVP